MSKLVEFIKEYNTYFVIICMLIITSFYVADINYTNGRISMCNEEGKFYTINESCFTCEETGRVWQNNECVVKQNIPKWQNTII